MSFRNLSENAEMSFYIYIIHILYILNPIQSFAVRIVTLACSTCSHDAIQNSLFHSPSASAALTVHFPSSDIFHSLFPYDVSKVGDDVCLRSSHDFCFIK